MRLRHFEHDKPEFKWCVWANFTALIEAAGREAKACPYEKMEDLIHYSEKVIVTAKRGSGAYQGCLSK